MLMKEDRKKQERKKIRKNVSFQQEEKFVVFDKSKKPKQVSYLGQYFAATKF